MIGYENTTAILDAYGNDIIKFAQINIGDRNRRRRSKITGKLRRGKIDSTGNLRGSFEFLNTVSKNSFGFEIKGADFAEDVDTGAKRRTSESEAKKWIRDKPIQFRDGDGRILKKTQGRIDNFAKFIAWKVTTIGSDKTDYLTDAIKDATDKHQADLAPALFKDIEAAVTASFKSINKSNK
jgi:hypothetical protein